MKEIILACVAIVVVILISVLIFFLIKYNVKRFKEENEVLNDKTISKNDMNKAIASYIKKVGKFGDFTLIYIDIDNFTNINEIFGREQCDEFLQELAHRFSKRLPYRTVISKYNNDEFLIFIKENLTYENACKIAEALLNDVKQKMFVSTSESIVLTASAGVCLYPSCGKTVPDLIKNLELATYISKREGGSKYTVFYNTLTKEETSNFKFFKEVKQAIANKEFCLYYQPIMNLESNNIYGFEALMRWNHPKRGILPPAEFINIMDQSGDIYWVGKWGLTLALKMLSDVQKLMEEGNAHISLNLSIKQLTYESLADDLILVAKKASVNPKSVILEIGGFAMFEKVDNVKQNLMKLRDFGFMTAVDGFELDYSTLTRIQKEPIDMIKLNRKFLADENSNDEIREKFVKMLTESAELTKRLVVAEGIETKENVDYVKSQNIIYGQGYYYSKPMPETEVLDFIRYRKWEENTKKAEEAKPKTEASQVEDTPTANNEENDAAATVDDVNTSQDDTNTSTQDDVNTSQDDTNVANEEDNDKKTPSPQEADADEDEEEDEDEADEDDDKEE
ncbi:MAG: EAL domain-containing protein [Anaeroplasmataceae bacterium]